MAAIKKKKKKKKKRKKAKVNPPPAGRPVMTTCTECYGSGEVQGHCEVCNVPLTHKNVVNGTDSICEKCCE